MYSKIQRDDIYKSHLLDFISQAYGLHAISFTEAKRGFYGETWRLETPDRVCFVKLDYSSLHKAVFRDSIVVVEHLCRHGVNCIAKVIKTANGTLFTDYDSAVLGVFEWIDGENIQNEMTKIKEYQMLTQVYTISSEGVPLAKESFGTAYIDAFLALHERLKSLADDTSTKCLLLLFDDKSDLIRRYLERFMTFAKRCRTDCDHFYITHGDAGGNIIVSKDKFYIVDWDEPKLAPPERDAWFCMHWSWAINAFHEALRQSGIEYALKPDRLAYYCYHNFFYYLTEYLTAFCDLPDMRGALLESVSEYFSGWIKDNLAYADKFV
jgi:hypothetical protein